MKFFRKLGFQLVLFFVVAITIPIVMLMVSSITTTSSSMENNMKVTSEQTLKHRISLLHILRLCRSR